MEWDSEFNQPEERRAAGREEFSTLRRRDNRTPPKDRG